MGSCSLKGGMENSTKIQEQNEQHRNEGIKDINKYYNYFDIEQSLTCYSLQDYSFLCIIIIMKTFYGSNCIGILLALPLIGILHRRKGISYYLTQKINVCPK